MKTAKAPEINSLTGSFLISTQKMPDPRFEEQVIFICAHSNDGAMGVAINRPNSIFVMSEVLQGAGFPVPAQQLPPIYIGGPVELESAFILYKSNYSTEYELKVSETVCLSRETKVLEDIAHCRGPQKYLFLLGYAGWGPGQIEQELLNDGWLIVPGSDEIIFDTPDQKKWRAAALQYGIDISIYGDEVGRA